MLGINFIHTDYLWLLLSIPLLLVFFYVVEIGKKRDLRKIGHPEIVAKLTRNISYNGRRFKKFLLLLACAFFTMSLMRPQWGRKLIKMERRGIDLVFVIDVSRSMLAEDIKPNRLEKAKIQISSFLDRLQGDRVGLVVFAGSSFVSCPLTLDYNALKQFIDLISTDMVSRQGTLLGNALRTARGCFESGERKHKAIVLLTDGEDHNSKPIKQARECRKEGIRIYTIGIGKRKGEPIPIKDRDGSVLGYVKDNSGSIVMSRLDEITLQKIAIQTGGKYTFSQYGELELDKIYHLIERLEKKKLGSRKLKQHEDRFQIFLIILLVLIVLEFLVSDRKGKGLRIFKDLNENKFIGRYE